MLKSEGYMMFRGSATVTPVNGEPFEFSGDWLYKPEWDCWYVKGHSIPAKIVSNIREEKDVFLDMIMEKIRALNDVVVNAENADEVRAMCGEIMSWREKHT